MHTCIELLLRILSQAHVCVLAVQTFWQTMAFHGSSWATQSAAVC